MSTSKLLEWQHALAALPTTVSVVTFEPNGINGCPHLQLAVDGAALHAYYSGTRNQRGDIEYVVRLGSVPAAWLAHTIVVTPNNETFRSHQRFVSAPRPDPRNTTGVIAGMVDAIGRAAVELAAAAPAAP